MAKKKHHEEEGGEAWLLPYSDLMTLLLAVFIVLFATSQTDEVLLEQMADAFRENLSVTSSVLDGSGGIMDKDGMSVIPLFPDSEGASGNADDGQQESGDKEEGQQDSGQNDEGQQESGQKDEGQQDSGQKDEGQQESGQKDEGQQDSGQNDDGQDDQGNVGNNGEDGSNGEIASMQSVLSKIQEYLEDAGIGDSVKMRIDARGLVISWNSTVLFDSGSAEIKPENIPDLKRIGELISSLDNYIRVEGHTDNVPMSSAKYPSNWELSGARASSVVKLFISDSGIDRQKLVVAGYGENKPIATNSTPEGRASNRRIDIVILSEKYNALEAHMQDVSP